MTIRLFVLPLLLWWMGALATPASAQIIQTIAGGALGDGGPATAALVNGPNGVAVDSVGNLYIADTKNNRIRKVSRATGIITTVAGTVSAGYNGDDIAATGALLSAPTGVAVDPFGNVFILDLGNKRIRKVTASSGVITTVAGTGEDGYNGDNIAATGAKLALVGSPLAIGLNAGIAVDTAGNLYIADKGNHRVRKVAAGSGVITTVAGIATGGYNGDDIAATSASLNVPTGIAVDLSGNLYIADSFNARVRKVNASTGHITTIAGDGSYEVELGDNIAATIGALLYPYGVAVDSSGNLFLAAGQFNARIRKVSAATGIITTVAGTGTAGYNGDNIVATTALLTSPGGIAVDSAGNLFVAELQNRIRKVTAATGIITTLAGTGGAAEFNGDNIAAVTATLNDPVATDVDSAGNLYIADVGSQRVRKINAGTGIITTVAGTGLATYNGDNIAASNAALRSPRDVAVDTAGNLYIADGNNHRVRKVAVATGIISTVAGNGNEGYNGDQIAATGAMLSYPAGVAVDADGNLYIADSGNDRVRKVTASTGVIATVAGSGGRGYNGDNVAATSATLHSPLGIAVDSSGNLFVAEGLGSRIRKVAASTGLITTVAGTGLNGYNGENIAATSARLDNPNRIKVDTAGNLYIADQGNNRIRKVSAITGLISTMAGNGTAGYNGDGIVASSAALKVPGGVTIDSSGNLYIADTGNQRIRKISSANYQGLWWNSPAGSESGWGINIAHQGETLFATWFTYDATGKALWLTMTATRNGNDYAGTLYRTRGPTFNAVPFSPATVTATMVGSATLTFSDAGSGSFAYTFNGISQTKPITRQVFGPLPTCTFGAQTNLSLATNFQDLWWAAPGGSESGWGVNFTHQGDTIFATWFTYDIDGSPLWLSATARKTGPGIYSGPLNRTTGPAFNAVPFLPGNVAVTPVGTLTLAFANGNAATFAYTVNGVSQSKSITRQVFTAPGTVCQ